jgi:VWFA-related protein
MKPGYLGILVLFLARLGNCQSYTISDNVDLVLLDASVQFPHDGYVAGLEQKNFRVFEDGHPRDITHFANTDAPVTVGLIVDESGSMRSKRAEVIMAGLAFERESNPQDEFFVVNFNDFVTAGLPPSIPFTDNLQMLRKALNMGEPRGRTSLYDAVAFGLRHLEEGHRDKRTLIVVSDGGDNVSKLSFSELLTAVEASRASIYTIGLVDPENRDLNPGVLRKMSALTGGEYFQPSTSEQISAVFQKISNDIRHRYTIGYKPDEETDKRILRTVKLTAELNGRHLLVRTRTTYSISALSQSSAR